MKWLKEDVLSLWNDGNGWHFYCWKDGTWEKLKLWTHITLVCVCTQAEVWVWRSMFRWFCPDMVCSVTVELAEHTVKSLHKHMGTRCLVRPQMQTYANLINPFYRATQPRVHLSVSVVSSPHLVFCQGYMLCLPPGLWYNHTHTERDREREGGSSVSILDVNQISSSVGTLKCFIKSEVLTGLN